MITDFIDYIGEKTKEYEFRSSQNVNASFLSVPVSTTEKGRLQRAFFTLELYSHLFHTKPDHDSIFTANEQSRLFFDRMPSWQIVELACVHNYLIDRLGDIFDEVENRFVICVLEENARVKNEKTARFENFCSGHHEDSAYDCELCASSGSESMSESESESASETMSDIDSEDEIDWRFSLSYRDGPDRFDYDDLFFAQLTKHSDHKIYMEYMISLGLDLFHSLFLGGDKKRFQIVVANAKYGGAFLAKSFEELTGSHMVVDNMGARQKEEIPWGHSLEFHGDNLNSPNLAWLWSFGFKQHSSSYSIGDSLKSCFLRSWGYTSRDATRIRSFHILDGR